MHKVVKAFTDLQDNNHVYHPGDIFPRDGVEVSEKRVAELASTENVRGEVLIEAVKRSQKAKIQPVKDKTNSNDELVAKAENKPKKAKKKEK